VRRTGSERPFAVRSLAALAALAAPARQPRRAPAAFALLLHVLCAGFTDRFAAAELEVRPFDPPDQAVVGTRPVFQLAFAGIADDALRAARFRIALSDDRFRSESHVFDQRRRNRGWAHADDGRVIFMPGEPIDDGDYEWRGWAWNGVDWVGGDATFRLRIDTTAPAPVSELVVNPVEGDADLVFSWAPVVLDAEGRSEYVARYRVYRFHGPPFAAIPSQEAGSSENERLAIEGELAGSNATGAVTYYLVIAEDQAGNRTVIRSPPSP